MKSKRLLSILLATVLLLTQFAMISTVFAAGSALSGRSDFVKGIHVHPSCIAGDSYAKTYDAVLNAEALGVNLIRSKLTNKVQGTSYGNEYDVGFANLAKKHGMDMMFVAPFPYKDSDGNLLTANQIDIEYIEEVYTAAATALQGKVAYYQIDNELDSIAIQKDSNGQNMYDGTSSSHFVQSRVNAFAVGIYAVNKAIKAVDPDAKTIVNFSGKEYGFIDALLNVKINPDTGRVTTASNGVYLDFDIIGVDYYSDMDHNQAGTTYQNVIETVHNRHSSKNIIVCEADIRPKAYENNEVIYWDNESWVDTFARYCYNKSYVKGFCSFELYDEPQYENDPDTGEWTGEFNREAHHGLIDKDGNKKDTYSVVKTLFGGTGVVADRTISAAPALSNEGVLNSVFQSTAVETGFPRVYSKEKVFEVENSNGVDFSGGNYIEFDLYVEDAEDFKAAMSGLGLYIHMFLYSDDDVQRNCRYIPIEYAVSNGWNHFKISKAAFDDHGETDLDWTAVNRVVLKFNGSIDNYPEISGMKLAIANICSTSIIAPANVVNEGKIVIDEEGVSGTIGTKAGNFRGYQNRGYNTGMEEYSVWESAVDFSECQKIEFDLYVENLEIFQKVSADCNSGNGLILRLISNSGATQHRRFYLSKYVTKQGWNHIVIPITDYDANNSFDTSTLRMYNLRFNQGSDQQASLSNTDYPAMYVAFKNFNGILADYYTSPDLPENRAVTTTDRVISTLGTSTPKLNNITTAFDTPLNLSNADYIEFDFYVENCAHFWGYQQSYLNSSSGGHGFCFYLSPSATAPSNSTPNVSYIRTAANKQIFLYFNDPDNSTSILRQQITEDGWNHIKIPLSEWKTGSGSGFGTLITDTSYFSSIRRVGVFCCRQTTTSNYKDEHIGFANLCGTVDEANRYKILPELPENTVASNNESVIRTYGDGASDIRAIAKNLATYPLNLSGADLVEFDLYVENIEHLWDYQETNMSSNNHYFCIFLSSQRSGGSDTAYITNTTYRVYYRFVDLKDQIVSNGWNHIVTKITDWNKGASGKATKADFSNIGRAGFFTTRVSVTDSSHVYADEYFGFANICGTALPELPENVVAANTTTVLRTYGDGLDDMRKVATNLPTDVWLDLSAADKVEFDIFVKDVEHFWDYNDNNQWSNSHYFCIFLSSEKAGGNSSGYVTNSNKRVYYRFADLRNQITSNGWNHIVTNITDWNKGESSKATKSDFSNIGRIGFFTARATIGSSHIYTGEHIGFANVCGTVNLDAPETLMSVKTDFIGAITKSIGFGTGAYTASLPSSLDISATRMLEIDVYVPGNAIDEIEIKLIDGSAGYAAYGISSLHTGWNHLAVKLNSPTDDGDIDLTDITGYALTGTAEKYAIVSNFYAADYVDGDANRDGEADILDYVRIKKYISTSGITGNVLAMKVNGTGAVGKADLQYMRKYLINGSWS